MLDIDNSVKSLFRDDVTHKNVVLTFPSINLIIENEQINTESLILTESISTGDSLEFGSCNSSMLQITVADVSQELVGLEFTIEIEIGSSRVPLGTFIVEKCEKQTDRRLKDITAYDRMSKFDVDVSSWWNSLTFDNNLTVKAFRESLCSYCGIPYHEQTLCNDSVIVEKTISVASVTARELMKACIEINGSFGHIDRSGTFVAITLNNTSMETFTAADYSCEYIPYHSDYTVAAIDKVQIKSEDEDIGGIYGTGTNALVVNANLICYGKNANELNSIAGNIYNAVSFITYKKVSGNFVGLPYLEVGDCISFQAGKSYVLSRTLTGIQALQDSISANGSETRTCLEDVNTNIQRIKALTHILRNTVEELTSIITNEDTGMQTIIQQLQDEISLEVIKKGNIISAINMSTEGITIQGNKIDLTGLVTINSIENPNENTKINGCTIQCSGEYQYIEMGETEPKVFQSKAIMTAGKFTVDNGKTGSQREFVNYGWEGFSTGPNPNTSTGGVDIRSNIFPNLNGENSYHGTTVYADRSPVGNMSRYNACIDAPQYLDEDLNPEKCVFSKHIVRGSGCLDYGKRTPNDDNTRFDYYAGLAFSSNGELYCCKGGNGDLDELTAIHASNIPIKIVKVHLNNEQTVITATLEDNSKTYWDVTTNDSGTTFKKREVTE